MTKNLGQTTLRRRRKEEDPMRLYDSLPAPLRSWLAGAVLPWSPTSARKLWQKAHAKGLSEHEAIAYLGRCEAKTLLRERS